MSRIQSAIKSVPFPSFVLGALGWVVAAIFFMFWLFDVGAGRVDTDRIGNADEWFSG